MRFTYFTGLTLGICVLCTACATPVHPNPPPRRAPQPPAPLHGPKVKGFIYAREIHDHLRNVEGDKRVSQAFLDNYLKERPDIAPYFEGVQGARMWKLITINGIQYGDITFHNIPKATVKSAIFGDHYTIRREPMPRHKLDILFPKYIALPERLRLTPLIEAQLAVHDTPTEAQTVRVNDEEHISMFKGFRNIITVTYKTTKQDRKYEHSLDWFAMTIYGESVPIPVASSLNASKRLRTSNLNPPGHVPYSMPQIPSGGFRGFDAASGHDVAPPSLSIRPDLRLGSATGFRAGDVSAANSAGVEALTLGHKQPFQPINRIERNPSKIFQPELVSTSAVVSPNAHVLAAFPSHITPGSGRFPASHVSTTLRIGPAGDDTQQQNPQHQHKGTPEDRLSLRLGVPQYEHPLKPPLGAGEADVGQISKKRTAGTYTPGGGGNYILR